MKNDKNWIRKEEISIILGMLRKKRFLSGLEIGAGSGFQSSFLKKICKKLVVTECNNERLVKKKEDGITYMICDAQALPFKENEFDFIFSSNVMEHIPDRKKALKCMKKAAKPEALMVHIMPTRVCKISQILFYYPNLIKTLMSRKRRNEALKYKGKKELGSNLGKRRKRSLISCIFPPVHGEYKSHVQEFIMSGKKHWVKRFEDAGLRVEKIRKLPFFFSYGFDIPFIRKILNKAGFSGSLAYFVKVEK